jgi:acetylornithine deacetylase/succinyl-diaminopimelate desuccinylase-like protein
MIAARALARAGIRLEGDLRIAGVAFETGAPSVDDRQGIHYPGEGFGSKWLVDRAVTADYVLIGETSDFGVIAAECGQLGLKVRLDGRYVYTPRLERGESLREHPSALVRMAHVVQAIEEWAIEYERRATSTYFRGTIVPRAQMTMVRATAGQADIHLDVRLAPNANPIAVRRDLRDHLSRLGLDFELSAFQWSRGYVAQNAEPLIQAVEKAHLQVFGSAPPEPPISEVSMWRDLNVFNEVGIPSICYGPPRQPELISDARDRCMKISDLVAATKVYALTAIELCRDADARPASGC